VFAVTFATYACMASPAMGWLDSPEFVAAGASLGIAHSPGHPLAGLLGRLATLLPVGDIAVRINLMSSLCAAAAAAGLFVAARALLTRSARSLEGGAVTAIAFATALVFAFSWAAWFQGVRAEVYALQIALLLWALAHLLAYDEDRIPHHLLTAGLLAGLALAHHNLMAVLFLVPAAIFVLARPHRERPSVRVAAATALCGVLGLAALLYLPVRAAAQPAVNWGDPQTVDRFAWTVSARAFQKSATTEHVSTTGEDTAEVIAALMDQGTPLLFVAALLGLYLGLRRRGHRRAVLLLGGIAGLAAAARVVIGFDPETPDHHAYLLPALACIVLLGATGLAQLSHLLGRDTGRALGVVVALVIAAIVPWQAHRHLARSRLSDAYASDAFARSELDELPPRTLLLIGYFQTSFRLWALRTVEEERPDVIVLDRSFMTYPGFADDARRRYPELAELIDAPLRAGAPTPVAQLVAQPRPVAIQLHPNLDVAPKSRLIPRGAYAWLQPTAATSDARAAGEAVDFAERERLEQLLAEAGEAERDSVHDALLWHDFLRLDFYCELGRRDAARHAFDRARRAAPDDEWLADYAKNCGLVPAHR